MTISDDIQIGFLIAWIVCIILVAIFGNVHFKNKKAENFRTTALQKMREYVGYYDKQPISDDEKANAVIDKVVKALNAKGYNVTDQTVSELKALREFVLTELRMKQAESGVQNTVKPEPEVSDKVDPKDVIQPTKPLNGGAVKAGGTIA